MAVDILLLLVGIAFLYTCGELLVQNSASLARALGVSTLLVGLTVVAFGTSAPELAVNLISAYRGQTGIAFGNVIGSNICNICIVIGVAAILVPLQIHEVIIRREIPMMVLSCFAGMVLAFDPLLVGREAFFDRSDGILFLLLFLVFLYYTIGDALANRATASTLTMEIPAREPSGRSIPWYLLGIGGGLVGVVIGGELTVRGAGGIAAALGMSELAIGLTIVAVGTSSPEIVTAIISARHGHTDMAVGTAVGSNIFNLLFIAGLTAFMEPIPIPPEGRGDIIFMSLLSIGLLPLAITDRKRLVRKEGIFLLALYVAYLTVRLWP